MIRTRFAPSPTGYLHIGGVRTALFNWLFARGRDGHFVLRIDDTDQERNVEEALQPILDGFRWLGLDWDEGPGVGGDFGPYRQSEKGDRYRAAAAELVEKGLAYLDFAKPEELQEEREAAQKEKRNFVYSRRWMAETAEDRERFEKEGRAGVVRLKMPREGACEFRDLIRGDVRVEWGREQDHVIQRADGSCLYHLANVVDDHDMEISHVLRAEEHLSNTPRQIFIAQGLGYELPEYGHVPFVAEPGSKNKLSKRKLAKYLKNPDFARVHERGVEIASAIGLETTGETFNPVIVDFYESVGYLPDAVVNYLLLLGWALDDRTEFFSRAEMLEVFSLERINKAPASFDAVKLGAFQEHYMQQVPLDRKVEMVLPYLERAGLIQADGDPRVRVRRVVEAAGDRIKVSGDVLDFASFFLDDEELEYDPKAFEKRIGKPEAAVALLGEFRERLSNAEDFAPEALQTLLEGFVQEKETKIGSIIHALRVAVTGSAVGFGMFDALSILGKESCLARIDRALEKVSS